MLARWRRVLAHPFALALGLVLSTTGLGIVPNSTSAQTAEPERGVAFLTLRDISGDEDPGRYYGDGRGTLSGGWCGITETGLGVLSTVAEAAPFHIPDEILRVDELRRTSPESVLDRLEETASGRPPLLYTHGFYIDFEKGCRRATVLEENAGQQGRFLWFSWPSDGDLLNYTRDEADMSWSVPDLANVISEMEAKFGPGVVNISGHSLGGRGMVLALYDVAARHPEVRLGEVVLLAPDMDFDLFRKLLPRIRPIVRGITIYVAEADRPLAT